MEKFTKEQAIAIIKEGEYVKHYPQVTSFVVCEDGNVFLPFNAADARAHARSKNIGIETILLSDLAGKSEKEAQAIAEEIAAAVAAAKEAEEKAAAEAAAKEIEEKAAAEAAAEKVDDKPDPGLDADKADTIGDAASETIEAAADAPAQESKVQPAKKGK